MTSASWYSSDSRDRSGSSNSSDFVSLIAASDSQKNPYANSTSAGSQALQVRRPIALRLPCPLVLTILRMLENPADESVVRWGNEGDSFVVLEVGSHGRWGRNAAEETDHAAEREIHKAHLAEAFQTQQLRQFR